MVPVVLPRPSCPTAPSALPSLPPLAPAIPPPPAASLVASSSPPPAPLGPLTKFAAARATTGETDGGGEAPADARGRRFALQGTARRLLPRERVARCLRAVLAGGTQVDVLQDPAHGGTHYGGLQVCGSVHACPVCAAKIGERRRAELEEAIAAHRAVGGEVLLVTYTVAHGRADVLQALLDAFLGAVRSLKGSRAYRALREAYGLVGTVRALEVTHGAVHGWHPHTHELLFLSPEVCRGLSEADLAALAGRLRVALYPLWARAAGRRGLGMSAAHGLDVRHTRGAVGDYLAKVGRDPGRAPWGPGCELAKAHQKTGRAGRRTPWDLLRQVEEEGDAAARDRFREYAAVFKGRHQLEWSKGLRERLGLGAEATDEELAARQEQPAVWLGCLTLDEWRLVLWGEARGAVLGAAAEGGWGAVEELVGALRLGQALADRGG